VINAQRECRGPVQWTKTFPIETSTSNLSAKRRSNAESLPVKKVWRNCSRLEDVMAMLRKPKSQIDLPSGWDEIGEKAAVLEAELQHELPASHELTGQSVQAIAVAVDSDEVLLDLIDQPGKVAAVHLTWSRHPEQTPWPLTVIFASLEEWRRSMQSPDS
jgi:hypothetical protein